MRIATSLLTAVSATVAFATPAIAPPPAPIEPAALIKKADFCHDRRR
jgi:hypothetical protein